MARALGDHDATRILASAQKALPQISSANSAEPGPTLAPKDCHCVLPIHRPSSNSSSSSRCSVHPTIDSIYQMISIPCMLSQQHSCCRDGWTLTAAERPPTHWSLSIAAAGLQRAMQQVSRFFQVPWMFKQQVPINCVLIHFFPRPFPLPTPLTH